MALENLEDGMTGLQMANAIKNNFSKVLDAESAENKAENAGKSIKTDYDATRYIELQLADGTPVKMKMDVFCQAIAPVVAGLMNTGKMFPFMDLGRLEGDANDLITSGMWRVTEKSTNVPGQYGVLCSYKVEDYIVQRFVSIIEGSAVYFRSKEGGNAWSNWRTI